MSSKSPIELLSRYQQQKIRVNHYFTYIKVEIMNEGNTAENDLDAFEKSLASTAKRACISSSRKAVWFN